MSLQKTNFTEERKILILQRVDFVLSLIQTRHLPIEIGHRIVERVLENDLIDIVKDASLSSTINIQQSVASHSGEVGSDHSKQQTKSDLRSNLGEPSAMDTEKVITAAAAAIVGHLTKSAAEPLRAAGGKAWSWLKSKITGTAAATAAEVEADPEKRSAPGKVTVLLQDLLHDNPVFAAELAELLAGELGIQAVTKNATIKGENNVVNQVSGSGNTITIR